MVKLAEFAVKGAALESRIEFDLLKAARGAEALFVTRGNVAGRRNALCSGLSAF